MVDLSWVRVSYLPSLLGRITVPQKSRLSPRPAKRVAVQSEFSQQKKRRPFTVFLIMDDAALRRSLGEMLRDHHVPLQDYMTAMEFYRDYRTPTPGVLLTEMHLRGMTGIELFEKLSGERKDLLVAFIAGHAEAPTAVRAMNAGAIDFLMKPVTQESLLGFVARAYAFCYDTDWDFVGEDVEDIKRSISRVTGRERQVLDLVAKGYSSREISAQLGISAKTVEAHRARINDKMRADDLPHLIRMILAYKDE